MKEKSYGLNYSRNWECFDQSWVNWTETVHAGTLRFMYSSHLAIVLNTCENLHYESVYFKELHNEQEYYWPTIYRAGVAFGSTITSNRLNRGFSSILVLCSCPSWCRQQLLLSCVAKSEKNKPHYLKKKLFKAFRPS